MKRELKYMHQEKKDDTKKAALVGWTTPKLETLFVLNSFYQRIVCPLLGSAEPPDILGKKIPIRYGQKILFDSEKNKANLKMGLAFLKICEKLGVSRKLLECQKTSDVVWRVGNPEFRRDTDDD